MKTLHIDIETYSTYDLLDVGVYKYVECPEFDILLFGYSWNDGPVSVIDLTSGPLDGADNIPDTVIWALTDPHVIKKAHNANFERVCLAKYFGQEMPPSQWRCSSAKARYNGLPGSLEGAGNAMDLEAKKDPKGLALIRYFSMPCKPTKTNNQRTRNLPEHAPNKWVEYSKYCQQDVVVEREIDRRLVDLPEKEQLLWKIDQEINDMGIRLDLKLVREAITHNQYVSEKALKELKELTGVKNPNAVGQLKGWLRAQDTKNMTYYHALGAGLTKETIPDLIQHAPNDSVKRVLGLRALIGKSSIKKYERMLQMRTTGFRVRGLLQYYGASRTGRWAGRNIQVHNLPRNYLKDLRTTRNLIIYSDPGWLQIMEGDQVPEILSQLVRTAFVPAPGNRFIVSDFNSIEARVLAWLAGEQWALEVFRGDGKIYETTAALLFGVPLETIVPGHENYQYRQYGKVTVLGLGYSMGSIKLQATAHDQYGLDLTDEEATSLTRSWRKQNHRIVRFWHAVEEAAIEAVETLQPVDLKPGLTFRMAGDRLWVDLPSGRSLCYVGAALSYDEKFQKNTLRYRGTDQKTGQWKMDRTYGGKLVENITQAIARDCLAESLIRLHRLGYTIVMHVHDEIVLEVPNGVSSVESIEKIMSQPIDWAPGLPLGAVGFECEFYQKG